MIKDFNINYGLSTELFIDGQVNPDLIIEAGCWYLCTDTAELFLGVQTEEGLSLKQINDVESHPVLNDVKSKVETVLPTVEKVEEEIVPTVEELKAWVDNKDFLQHIDLNGYATEEFVEEAFNNFKVPEPEIYKVDFNAPNFTDALEAYNNGKVLVLINAAPDVNSYAVMNYVSNKYITFTKFLMSRSETYGAFNTYYLSPANTWEVSKEVRLNKVEANVEDEANGELINIRIGKEVYNIPTGGPAINLDDYYTKEEVDVLIPDVSEFIKDIPAEYITEDELTAKGYLTEHQSLEGYAKVSDLPSVDGLASESYVDEKVAGIVIPEIPSLDTYAKKDELFSKDYNDLTNKPELFSGNYNDLSNKPELFDGDYNSLTNTPEIPSIDGLATEQFVKDEIAKINIPTVETDNFVTTEVFTEFLTDKADKILFTTAKFVNNPIGGFIEGEDIKGFTIAELFAKLLGLSDTKPSENPDEPEVPSDDATPEEVVDYLIKTETPMYSQDKSGNLIETPFASNIWSQEEAAVQMNGISTIYHIEDASGNVIESGYQESTDYNEEAWLTVALPNNIKAFSIKKYDSLRNGWYPVEFEMVVADDQSMEGYTIWTVPEKYEVTSGSTYRFVIE